MFVCFTESGCNPFQTPRIDFEQTNNECYYSESKILVKGSNESHFDYSGPVSCTALL